ncbi:MAG TPA: hypothetical protein VMG08_00085 [Allosphingosinicella sp.]|nr:hypothetical protein [Allosphingosinicella sp.]
MSFSFSDFSAALKAGHRITPEDVLAVRRAVWPDGRVSDAEAGLVFDLNRLIAEPSPEWRGFFIEAMTDYVVNQKTPRGYVDEANGDWLIAEVDRDGEPVSRLELELVVKVIERALNCPARLRGWALAQIEEAVGRGTRTVDADECRLLRRLVFAPGGEGALVVGQDEAEALWRLKDACLQSDNCPEWKTLFVQALGNHLMGFSSYAPLAREEAARLEAFVDDHRASVLGFFGRMRGANPLAEARQLFGEKASVDHAAGLAEAEAVTPTEQGWLDGKIEADGARDPYEEALLAFVAAEKRA